MDEQIVNHFWKFDTKNKQQLFDDQILQNLFIIKINDFKHNSWINQFEIVLLVTMKWYNTNL